MELSIWFYPFADIEQVKLDVVREPERMRPRPGMLTLRGITRMAEELCEVVKMIVKFSTARGSKMISEKFIDYSKRDQCVSKRVIL
jgi:hypothetical protein